MRSEIEHMQIQNFLCGTALQSLLYNPIAFLNWINSVVNVLEYLGKIEEMSSGRLVLTVVGTSWTNDNMYVVITFIG